jgi:hypothetical protein
MEVDGEAARAEVEAAFGRYERALIGNDLDTLDALFWHDGRTVRYGVAEALYGIEEIRAFRRGRAAAGLGRALARTVITTFGRDFATTSTLFVRDGDPGRVGRQQQSWVRFAEGWRIVAAHVSVVAGSP